MGGSFKGGWDYLGGSLKSVSETTWVAILRDGWNYLGDSFKVLIEMILVAVLRGG